MKDFFLAFLLFCGIALAGSEGPNFPLVNLGGVALLIIFGCLARKREIVNEDL